MSADVSVGWSSKLKSSLIEQTIRTELFEDWGIFDLKSLSVECVVLRLLGDGRDEVVLLRNPAE